MREREREYSLCVDHHSLSSPFLFHHVCSPSSFIIAYFYPPFSHRLTQTQQKMDGSEPTRKMEVYEADDDSVGEDEEEEGHGGEFGFKKKKLVVFASGSVKKGSAGSVAAAVSPPRCQAEMCAADLTAAKRYHKRHKVCESHAKASAVVVGGVRQRFCQQCSRFHELSEFDDTKRSCRKRLAGHNERRRKSSSESNGEGSSHQRSSLQLSENQPRPAADRGRTLITLPGDPTYKQFHVR